MIVSSEIPHSPGKWISTNLKSFCRLYLRIAASVFLLLLPPLLLLFPLIWGPGELAVATVGVAHGDLAIRNRGLSGVCCSCRQRFRIIVPRRRSDSQSIWAGKINRRHFSKTCYHKTLCNLSRKRNIHDYVCKGEKLYCSNHILRNSETHKSCGRGVLLEHGQLDFPSAPLLSRAHAAVDV